MSDQPDVTVFRASKAARLSAIVGMIVLVLLAVRVFVAYGFLATIAIALSLGIGVNLWWNVLRPRLVADADGVSVVSGRQSVAVAWRDIQRTEVGPKGTLIVARGGQETFSRYPHGARSGDVTQTQTEGDHAAAFLAARSAWGRRADGSPPPRYQPPTA